VSDTRFIVRKAFADRVLQHPEQFIGSLSVVPHERNGQIAGMKLYGIRHNSLLDHRGLQNGDLLRSINGAALSDSANAVDAFVRLRSAQKLAVAIERNERALDLGYEIR
jgi:general secretion pathway protein C